MVFLSLRKKGWNYSLAKTSLCIHLWDQLCQNQQHSWVNFPGFASARVTATLSDGNRKNESAFVQNF